MSCYGIVIYTEFVLTRKSKGTTNNKQLKQISWLVTVSITQLNE